MRCTNPREVSSPANSLLKVFRRALAEGTTKQGWLAVEGPFLVEEALNAAPARQNSQRVGGQRRSGEVLCPAPTSDGGSRNDAGP